MRGRRFAIGAGAVAVGLALCVSLLPGLLFRSVLLPRVSAGIGTPVHASWLSWNPFRGTWTLHAIRVDADRGPPALRVRRAVAGIWLVDLVRRRWVVRDLRLVGVRARLRQTGVRWELPLAARPPAAARKESGSAWPIFALDAGHAAPLALRFEGHGGPPAVLRLRRVELAGVSVAPGAIRAAGSLRGRLGRGRIGMAASFRRTETSDRLRTRISAAGLDVRRTLRLLPGTSGRPEIAGLLDLRAGYEQLLHRGHGHRRASGRGRVREFALDAGGSSGIHAASVRLDRFDADLEARTIRLGRAALNDLQAWLTQKDEGLALPGVLSPASSSPASGAPPWRVAWNELDVSGGTLHYVDARAADRRLEIELAHAHLAASAAPEASTPLTVAARLPDGGEVSVDAALVREPFGLRGEVSFDAVALPPLAVLAAAPLPLESGRAGGRLTVDVGTSGFSASGSVTVEDLKTAGPIGGRPEDVLAFKTLRAQLRSIRSDPRALEFDSVAIEWPYVLIDRGPEGVFPLTVAVGTASEPSATPPTVRIDTLSIHGGRIDFRDLTLTPPYWRSLANFDGTGQGISLPPAQVTRLRATGLIDELSPLRVEGSVGTRTRLRADVERVALPPFNAYLKPVSDYAVSSGLLTAHSEITLERSQLEVTNRVVLSRLGLGGAAEEDFVQRQLGIPLTLAVALMKDYRGDIALDLPFTGNVATPTFSLRGLVLQAVLRAIRGAVLSPLTALGRVFVQDGRIEQFTVDPVPFPPGGRELDAAGRERIAQVAHVLAIHPELVVTARGSVATADVDHLQEEKALPTLGTGRDAARLRAVLEARLRGRPEPPLDPGERQRLDVLIRSLPWPAEELRQLAADRAAAVAAALLLTSGLDARRVRTAPATAPPPGSVSGPPAAMLELSEG